MKFALPLLALTLAACQTNTATTTADMSNDMLPSAEVRAFQEIDRRLGYDGAEIAHDETGCAIYSATGPDGAPYTELLRTENGARICSG